MPFDLQARRLLDWLAIRGAAGIAPSARASWASRAGLMLVHCAILILVIVSAIEVYQTIAGIIRDLERDYKPLLLGALLAALVPSGAMVVWSGNAIARQLDLPIRRVRRYFRSR